MRMRIRLVAWCLALLCIGTAAPAATSVSVSIGINVPAYPQLVVVPGYPVYYAPALPANYFFYDGMYWVLVGDTWAMSSWYNGPWVVVAPDVVPYYVLRVPVRYYRAPPPWFHGWAPGAPPRWGQHWGPQWEQQHRGWDRWNRRAVPAPAPLPTYQRQYAGARYPPPPQQAVVRDRHYHHEPRSEAARQHVQATAVPPAHRAPPAPQEHRPPPAPLAPQAVQAPPHGREAGAHPGQVPPGTGQPPGPPGRGMAEHGRGKGHERVDDKGQDGGRGKGGKD